MGIGYLFKKTVKNLLPKLTKSKPRLPILFVHVPKTAGTSFRNAANQSAKIDHVLCDYGKDNETTTFRINYANYYSNDKLSVELILRSHENYILTGHFSVNRYKRFFFPYEIGIFIRNPVNRVLSNYYHKQRKEQFEGGIEEFIQTNAADNLQLKHFGELAPEYFGFIGISERYQDSITLVNALYSIDLEVLSLNLNPEKKSSSYEIEDKITHMISELNCKEIELYKTAEKLFLSRLRYKKVQWSLYGSWQFEDEFIISGRAYRAYSEAPVNLNLQIDGQIIASTTASNYDPIPCDVRQPLEGYIGFRFDIRGLTTKTGSISISAADTDEPLFNLEH
jgi:hypothetical protein